MTGFDTDESGNSSNSEGDFDDSLDVNDRSNIEIDIEDDLQVLEEAIRRKRADDTHLFSAILSRIESSPLNFTEDDLRKGDYTSEFIADTVPFLYDIAVSIDEGYSVREYLDPETTPVTKGHYTWEHHKIEYYYVDYDYEEFKGTPPTAGEGRFEDKNADESGVIEHNPEEYLGFEPEEITNRVANAGRAADGVSETVDENTVHVPESLDEDDFFSTFRGRQTVATRYDLEKKVPNPKKKHFKEIERYWVNEPFAFVVIYRSQKENEYKYYVVEPHLTEIEEKLFEYLIGKLRTAIKYAEGGGDHIKDSSDLIGRSQVIERETVKLLNRYELYTENEHYSGAISEFRERVHDLFEPNDGGVELDIPELESDASTMSNMMARAGVNTPSNLGLGETVDKIGTAVTDTIEASYNASESIGDSHDIQRDWVYIQPQDLEELDGSSVRPEPKIVEEDSDDINEYQLQKFLYFLKRDFVGYERIDPIKRDINVEDVSCNGYNSPVFVYHTDYEQIISNTYHGESELDKFVVKLAQRSGQGISKRQPQQDVTLPDGSRGQLTLGDEVSDHGTNYTIRQFKDVPFTPVDLINWRTFSLDQMAFLWLAIENNKSLLFAGGTASGKTTSLNAVSLFIPSTSKIVSIEDTREVELPQRNWTASVTRPSFSEDSKGDIDEFDLLEAALRQRPEYIVMGEVRGEEGRTMFQVMSTGHTTYSTFHADTVGEVLKRFTTDPINVSKTMFTALDLVSIQTSTRVQGNKVRRNKTLTEVNSYDAENDEINVQDVFTWQAETDSVRQIEGANILQEIMFDRGWDQQRLEDELFKRRVVLAYLVKNNLSEYSQVAATIQGFIHDPETILSLISNDGLEESLKDLREMESVLIDIDQEKEDMVPRPTPDSGLINEVDEILDEAKDHLFTDISESANVDLTQSLSEAATESTDHSSEFDGVDVDDDEDLFETQEGNSELFDGEGEFSSTDFEGSWMDGDEPEIIDDGSEGSSEDEDLDDLFGGE